jgi:hypothetical protein
MAQPWPDQIASALEHDDIAHFQISLADHDEREKVQAW